MLDIQEMVAVSGREQFRVFRLDDDGVPVYVGTFEPANPKEAIKKGFYAHRADGHASYEPHVLPNASMFDTNVTD